MLNLIMSKKKLNFFRTMFLLYGVIWGYCWYRSIFPHFKSFPTLFWIGTVFYFGSLVLQFKRTLGLSKKKIHGKIEYFSYMVYSYLLWLFPLILITDLVFLFQYLFGLKSVNLIIFQSYLFVLPIILMVWGWLNTYFGPRLKFTQTSLKKDSSTELKILQISDLHVGLFIQDSYVKKVINKFKSQEIDLLVMTGDMVDTLVKGSCKEFERLLKLDFKFGKYLVLGNHEYYWGANEWVEYFKKYNVKVLQNSGEEIKVESKNVWIAGVNDQIAQNFSSHEATSPKKADSNKKYDFKLMLSHRPEEFEEVEELGYSLMLSGHTHGGQFFPFSFFVKYFNSFVKGENFYKNLKIYVSQGTGFWGFPCRIGTESELTLHKVKF